ncbi:MAG: hypothetical protein RR435_07495 [Erysipelotrichaceae bacterium]
MELTKQAFVALINIINPKTQLFGLNLNRNLSKTEYEQALLELSTLNIIINGEITDYGYTTLQILEVYSKATKFVSLDNNWFASYGCSEFVYIGYYNKLYHLELMNIKELITSLISKLPTWYDITNGEYDEQDFTSNDFLHLCEENPHLESIALVCSNLNTKKELMYMLFIKDEALQIFSISEQRVKRLSKNFIESGMERLLEMRSFYE